MEVRIYLDNNKIAYFEDRTRAGWVRSFSPRAMAKFANECLVFIVYQEQSAGARPGFCQEFEGGQRRAHDSHLVVWQSFTESFGNQRGGYNDVSHPSGPGVAHLCPVGHNQAPFR